ncbi:MAG: amidohydrolase [Coprococcus sp.]
MQVEGQEPWYLPESAGEIKIVEAMLVEEERIVQKGSDGDILKLSDPDTECIDLKGRCVIPAFNDSHCHILATGLNLVRLNLCGARSCEEIIERGRKYIREMPLKENDWIVGYGFDQNIFDDPVLPDKKTTEAISTEHPVFLDRICGHVGAVNQAALDIAGYDARTVVTGGVLDKDEQGDLNGILREAALDKMRRMIPLPSEETLISGLKKIMAQANSYGITSVQTDDLESTSLDCVIALYKKLIGKHEMTLRIYEEIQQPRVPQLKEFLRMGFRTGDGDEYFKIGNIKLLTDGSLGARTAYMAEEYADDAGNAGVAVYTQEALNEVVCLAHSSGMQIAFHAIGDGAVEQAVNAVEEAQKCFPDKKMRHRIVHCQFVNKNILDRMKAADIGADIQPPFTASDYSLVAARLGEDRGKWGYMWRTMAEKQIPMGGGSDSPVESMDPLWGIYCAVTRKDKNGEPEGGWHPDEKLTVSQAVALYTRGSAYAEFAEQEKGQLLPGMLADFVVLSENIFEIPEKQLSEVQIEETYFGGNLCYRRQ